MSRQFDEYMADRFEINGELYTMVEPTNFEELKAALKTKDILQCQYDSLMHDDDSKDSWLSLLQEQEEYINQYIENIGDFDNRYLVSNINYLAKSNDLRIGDVEKLLGLSAGYISRTAKENSGKKLSVDVVWKLSKLFNISIKSLLETDLRVPYKRTEMIKRFLAKLYKKTVEDKITWSNQGGFVCQLDNKYVEMGLITENEDGPAIYNSDCLNPEIKWELINDIYALRGFDASKDLVIISVQYPNSETHNIYDFLLVWNEGNENRCERMFCTSDDAFAHLADYAGELVEAIESSEFEPKIAPEHRDLIANFLREDV